ncbi:uroporphyrinogen-III C-methyltransferase [Billgrantia sp. LNSP4103-1]|uniref:uroporphyrinogen-III C-methyltransferase n=1 Tax=Billgrantia sp. LNSP4103-1 TaxID=3410266 RepID=UPI00403EFE42
MSKQTNDQDEQKSPSGKGQNGKGRESGAGNEAGGSPQGSGPAPQSTLQGKSGESEPAATAGDAASSGKGASASAGTEKNTSAGPGPGNKAQPDAPSPAKAGSGNTKPASTGKAAAAKPDESKSAGKPAATDKPATGNQSSDKPGADATRATPPGGDGTSTAAVSGGGGKGGSRAFGVLALILVLFLGIGAGLFAWQAWERLDAQQQRLAELEERAGEAASADDVASLREQLESGEQERDAALSEAIESMQGEFASYRSEVDETLDQVLDELSRTQDTDEREWLHAEAAYLLRLANQRLHLERDVEGAQALLRTADERLSEADNPALLSVRRAIASELSILDGVPEVDRTGLYLALNAQQERLGQLPLSRELEEIPARSGIEEAPSGGWQEQLSRFGQELKDLIVIRHHDEALEGLVTPEQESYLRQSARLVIEQAQLALLEEEQELYEASIDKALELIRGYYDTDNDEVQAVVDRLEELKDENIQPELPDISGSHEALAEFIERRFGSRSGQGDET